MYYNTKNSIQSATSFLSQSGTGPSNQSRLNLKMSFHPHHFLQQVSSFVVLLIYVHEQINK